jgi:hypothetical protein
VAVDDHTDLVPHSVYDYQDDGRRTLDTRYLVGDLDGDGSDDIVEINEYSIQGVAQTELSALVVRDRSFRAVAGPQIAFDTSGMTGADQPGPCTSSVAIEGHQIVVTATTTDAANAMECLSSGRHLFQLHGGKLVESPR